MIDWDRVRELHNEIGEEAFEEVLTLFVEEVDDALARLRMADAADVRMAEFHFLKGAALNLGLREMADVCGRAEELAGEDTKTDEIRAGVLSDFPEAIATLREVWRDKV
ncbi:Hpt domain-containing protein [Roseinatronobacter sp. S2]|uniref:Hpt domain-containing protein n=1 Tax=Roseinatronobacter sp. S2 TaxID=3035471 RepID=UPI00240F156F|nr:Hpt domain-containing protein [Roseinatronobacter sp. S2]WFE76073.1 Hpt domain-containing protein [Roseinatronobacter sp. S2]